MIVYARLFDGVTGPEIAEWEGEMSEVPRIGDWILFEDADEAQGKVFERFYLVGNERGAWAEVKADQNYGFRKED